MLYFLTIMAFGFFISLLVLLFSYLKDKYSSKRIDKVDKIDMISGSLTAAFGYLIYCIAQENDVTITNMAIEDFPDFIILLKTLCVGLVIGGLTLLSVIGICVVPFVFVYETFSDFYNIPEKQIFRLYSSMFLIATFSLSIVAITTLYFIKSH
jgi:hypothetical protein